MFKSMPFRLIRRIVRRASKEVDINILYKLSRLRAKEAKLLEYYVEIGVPSALTFSFEEIKSKTLSYVTSMKVDNRDNSSFEFMYSESSRQPCLYASVYACMIKSLYGQLSDISENTKREWTNYFNAYQSQEDGLFRDPVLQNTIYETEDWWGARHIALHMISAYTALGGRPKHDFLLLEPFYNEKYIESWLEDLDWAYLDDQNNDIDNKIMNIGCMLQYSRDAFENENAGEAVKILQNDLAKRINPNTGLWGPNEFKTADELSRAVQFAYHLYPILNYDNFKVLHKEKIIDHVLRTQNRLGGFGVMLNSSACEDIDSVELLYRLSHDSDYRATDINRSLRLALPWNLSNMNFNGGFVFRRNEEFEYGHKNMSSGINESNLFATWFRTLCLAYLVNYLESRSIYNINIAPGYEF